MKRGLAWLLIIGLLFARVNHAASQDNTKPVDLKAFVGSWNYVTVFSDPWVRRAINYAMGSDTEAFLATMMTPIAPVELRYTKDEPGWYILLRGRHTRASTNESSVLALRWFNSRVELQAGMRHAKHASEWTTGSVLFDDPDEPVISFVDRSFARHPAPGITESTAEWHQNGNSEVMEVGSRECAHMTDC